MRRAARRSLHAVLAIALPLSLLIASSALAAGPSAGDKETARALLIDGRAKMAAKDYQGALKSLRAAHDIMHVPTTGLDYAAALEATGQLVEARTLALDINRMPVTPNEPEAFANARVEAAGIAERLAARIPSVTVTVKGLAPGVEPAMTIDGADVPSAAIGLPRKANPGTRTIVVSASGYFPVEKKVELKEGQAVPIEITLKPGAPIPVKTGPGTTVAQGTGDAVVPGEKPKTPVWAYVTTGVGVAAVGVGIGFAVDYGAVKSLVASDCPDNACHSTIYNSDHLPDQVSRWNRDVGIMAGAGIGGIVLVTVGVVGIARVPRAQKTSGYNGGDPQTPALPSFTPLLSPHAAGGALTGSF